MKPGRPTSPEAYTLLSRFDEIREELDRGGDAAKMARPLGYWALPRDRRLPYALLDRTLGDLIGTAFTVISATPGIGPKKIASLVMLLERAVQDGSFKTAELAASPEPPEQTPGSPDRFDPVAVSESSWERWQNTARRFELGNESLGRLAATLRTLPTVVWKIPLNRYLGLSLGELRTLKTHGDKRVRAVLEVFYTIHRILQGSERYGRLLVQPIPFFVVPIEQWIRKELNCPEVPRLEDLRQNLALPLLNQIEIDAGETVHRLAAGRLGIESPVENAREQAHRLGVTRARIYQLLEICAHVMDVRWPDGRWWLAELGKKFERLDPEDERVQLFAATWSMAYPERIDQELPEPVWS